MELWAYIILFTSVLIGGGLAFRVKSYSRTTFQLILSFVGAYVLGISVLHLMPEVFGHHDHFIGIWVLVGFFVQLILEMLSGGVEHGHIHPAKQARASFAIQIMLGLCIHAFFEGMPLGNYEAFHDHIHPDSGNSQHLFYGIILHKAPAAFVLVLLLLNSKFQKQWVLLCLLIFALMSPLGALTTSFLEAKGLISIDMMRIFIAIVVGSFLHISTTILFEVENPGHHHISWKKLLVIIVGLGFAFLTTVS